MPYELKIFTVNKERESNMKKFQSIGGKLKFDTDILE